MTSMRRREQERGAALVLVIMALLLITGIALAMMFSADTETAIAANYRDKQVALYAAQSGLQEARDRIQPSTGDIAAAGVPSLLPSAGAANVVYILNPGKGETDGDIKPWVPGNKYYDADFCNKVPSLCSGTPKVPTATSGYTVFDNSALLADGTANPYNAIKLPLNFKWARLLLKSDRMTSVVVKSCDASTSPATCTTAASEKQVCWDGNNQVLAPTGYGTDCGPQGALTTLTLTTSGSGYSSDPTVTISAPTSGVQATATAHVTLVTNGQVANVNVTSGGSGYTTAPTVTFVPKVAGVGSGATGVAIVAQAGSPVNNIAGFNAGTGCYASATPAVVTLSGGGGAGATATSTMTGKACVVSWSASGSCPKSYAGQTITVNGSGGPGSGFSGKITFKNGNASVSGVSAPLTPGSGYSTPPTGVSAPAGCTLTTSFVLGYNMSAIALGSKGTGYSTAPAVSVTTPQAGTIPTATAVLGSLAANAGQVTGVTVMSPGSGYAQPPDVVFTSASGTGAAAQAQLNSTGSVTTLTLQNPGSGYTVPPTVSIANPGGSGTAATATATVDHRGYMGQIYLISALASAPGGSKAMSEMEAATAVRTFNFSVTGALTLAGPSPSFGAPSSNNFQINGKDANSCAGTSMGKLPAIGVYQDPNSKVSVVDQVKAELPRAANYTGIDVTADVHDVTQALGDMASGPSNFDAMIEAAKLVQTQPTYGNNPSAISMGCDFVANPNCSYTTTAGTIAHGPAIDVVNGDLDFGPLSGYGILVVTGNVTMHGNFSWKGLILVLGDGGITFSGGGNGQVTGSIVAAHITDNSGKLLDQLGSPDVEWNGGGGNGIQYDHCWADDLLARVPYVPPPSKSPLQVLSVRSIGN